MTETSLNIAAAVLTDRGCQRVTNEDCGVFIRPASDEVLASKGVLAVVADGMGGHSGGDVASSAAVEAIGHSYYESDAGCETALAQAFREANRTINDLAASNQKLRGMGTTCTALVVRQGQAYSAHVGDSRLYLVRNGQVYAMTETHSAVMEQVRNGVLTLDEARQHEDRNVILRSLGGRPEVDIAVWQEPLPVRAGDCFVLCSDGLYDVVSDEEIGSSVRDAEPVRACEALIQLALSRGAPDNVTAVVVSISDDSAAQTTSVPQTREAGVLT